LLQLDGTLITVALPSVAHGLSVPGSSTSAVLSAYFAAYALMLIPGGELVDRYGARRLALIGLALFAVGAIAGALAQSFGELIGARVIQGAGAGLVSPAALAGAVSGFPAERRGAALGIWGASAGMSNLLGPLLGGLLTIAFGWRADWWALVPLAGAAAIGVALLVPRVLHAPSPPGDVDARPFVNRIVVAATVIAALTFGVMIGAFYIAEQYLQRVAGFSALGAAAALVLVALLVGVAAPIAGKLVDTRGEVFVTVLGFLGTGVGLMVLGISGVPLDDLVTILPLIPVGLGLGMLFVPVSRAALNSTPEASHGRTSALLSVGRLLGAAVGASLAGVALSGTLTADSVHHALLIGAAVCLLIGIPSSLCLRPRAVGVTAGSRG
jgi:MFS transporter, DHA2 family, methylenomycin A resistance protein